MTTIVRTERLSKRYGHTVALDDLDIEIAAGEVFGYLGPNGAGKSTTIGLLLVIFGIVRSGRSAVAPFAVGGYIAAAYWFTSSTSFANPAVTIARMLSNTFAGIRPSSVPAFVAVQIVAALCAVLLVKFLHPGIGGDDIVVPHEQSKVVP